MEHNALDYTTSKHLELNKPITTTKLIAWSSGVRNQELLKLLLGMNGVLFGNKQLTAIELPLSKESDFDWKAFKFIIDH